MATDPGRDDDDTTHGARIATPWYVKVWNWVKSLFQ